MRVADLRPGMVLGEAVRDVNGRLLAGEGAVLDERSIGVLKAWGVGEVALRGERPLGAAPPSGQDKALELAGLRFRQNRLDHRFTADAHRLAAARLARLLETGEVPPLAASVCDPPAPSGEESPRPRRALDPAALAASNPPLGAMPGVLGRLARAMEDPGASPVEVASIIMNDPGLAATLLKVANSAMYGFPQRIETISRAVTVIGVQQLSALALGLAVIGLFKDMDRGLIEPRAFWRHSLACACGARALASVLGLPNTERYFVAGLLHDAGLLLLILHAPEPMREALSLVRGAGEGLVSAERAVLGTDHAAAGAALLESWGLPPALAQAAAFHHEPLASPEPRDAGIVHAADFLAEALVFGSGGQSVLMPLDTQAFDLLGAPPGAAGLVFDRVEAQLGQLEPIFLQNVPA